jgi:hypothetical protein
VHSLIDVDSPHVSSVPSDFDVQSIKTETQADRIEREQQAKELAEQAKAKAAAAKERAKGKGRKAGQWTRENADNPVVLGNALLVGGASAALGFAAYKKYTAGEFTWKVAGIGAGIVGLFALGDYYVSKYVHLHLQPDATLSQVGADMSLESWANRVCPDTCWRSTRRRNRYPNARFPYPEVSICR